MPVTGRDKSVERYPIRKKGKSGVAVDSIAHRF
jgi:hypothetical protein